MTATATRPPEPTIAEWVATSPGLLERIERRLLLIGPLLALAVIPLAAAAPGRVVAVTWGLGILVLTAAHPPAAIYLLLGVTPLVVGMDRGDLVPLLRPNEVLLAVLIAGVGLHLAWRLLTGRPLGLRRAPLDVPLLVLTVAGSILPLLWMLVRGADVSGDDVLYATTFWKYLGVYALVRVAVRTERQVRICLWLSMGAAAIVATIGILQALKLFGVPGLLASHYAPFEETAELDINRGTSTIASAHAAADVLTFNLGIAIALIARRDRATPLLLAGAGLFGLGVLASGTFSGVTALLVGLTAIGVATGQLRRAAAWAAPLVLLAAIVLQPVIDERVDRLDSSGVPSSWIARLENLRTHFWPDLFSDYHWVLGVRPAGRLPAPEEWRDWVFIESGHTWLLWVGGVPLFLAFAGVVLVTLRSLGPLARRRPDAIGAAAASACTAIAVIAVLMTFDPHLTLRGTADLAFPLLALAMVGWGRTGPPSPADRSAQPVAV